MIYLDMADAALVHVHVDDLPAFVLAGFGEHRARWGSYPRFLRVSPLLGHMMGARAGVWRPVRGFPGVWGWYREFDRGDAPGMDEYGKPE